MPCSHLAGILCVVIEILVGQKPVLVPHEAVCLDIFRVELNLELYILSYGEERASELLHQYTPCLLNIVYIGVVPVALIGDDLHLVVLDVSHPESEDSHVDAEAALLLHQLLHRLIVRNPDVEVAVGCQDDAVVATTDKILFSDFIGQRETCAAGGRATGIQTVNGFHDGLLPVARG